jgi:hypothetical protein
VEDEIHRLLQEQGLRQIVGHEHERVVPDVLDVPERARIEVVDAQHAVPAREQEVAQMAPEEAGAAGNDRSRHVAHLSERLTSYVSEC